MSMSTSVIRGKWDFIVGMPGKHGEYWFGKGEGAKSFHWQTCSPPRIRAIIFIGWNQHKVFLPPASSDTAFYSAMSWNNLCNQFVGWVGWVGWWVDTWKSILDSNQAQLATWDIRSHYLLFSSWAAGRKDSVRLVLTFHVFYSEECLWKVFCKYQPRHLFLICRWPYPWPSSFSSQSHLLLTLRFLVIRFGDKFIIKILRQSKCSFLTSSTLCTVYCIVHCSICDLLQDLTTV